MYVHKQAHRLSMLREKHDLTVRELGKAIGVSGSVVARWCSGKTHPSRKHTRKICDYFKVEPAWLIYGVGGKAHQVDLDDAFKNLTEENKNRVMELALQLLESQKSKEKESDCGC